jgi:hypothetical protein
MNNNSMGGIAEVPQSTGIDAHISLFSLAIVYFRSSAMAWIAAAFLPIPVLMTMDWRHNAVISCIYLGLASAWLACEIFSFGGMPVSRITWSAKTLTTALAVSINAAFFIALGASTGVQANFPFPLMALLSVVPAIGLVPWLAQRVTLKYGAIFFGVFILGVAKIAGCAVARINYGPDYMELGRIGADWRTAKLMISTFWALTVAMSLAAMLADFVRFKPDTKPV